MRHGNPTWMQGREWMQAAEKAQESSDQVGSLRQITDVEKKQESLVEG